jgi:hypothetical protein
MPLALHVIGKQWRLDQQEAAQAPDYQLAFLLGGQVTT